MANMRMLQTRIRKVEAGRKPKKTLWICLDDESYERAKRERKDDEVVFNLRFETAEANC